MKISKDDFERRPRVRALAALIMAIAVPVACSSSGNGTGSTSSADMCAGGPTAGPADMHCVAADGGAIVQPTDIAACAESSDGGVDDTSALPDGGALPCYEDLGAYGATMYGNSGSDDDCKYDVTWSSSPSTFCATTPITLTVKATHRTDGSPLTGAAALLEIVTADCGSIPAKQPLPSDTVESPPGTYTMGPVVFGKSGSWVVRFHLYETYNGGLACSDDQPDSPHGHAAFWVTVP